MSYIRSSLGANETVHYIAHFPIINYILAYGALILSVVLGLWTYAAGSSTNAGISILALIAPVIGVIVFLMIMIPIWTTEIGVTNQRIILKQGFIRRLTSELQLRSIEEVNVDQGILGRIFGYGRINIFGTGDDKLDLPPIGDALMLRKALQEAIGEAQNQTRPVSSGASPQRAPA